MPDKARSRVAVCMIRDDGVANLTLLTINTPLSQADAALSALVAELPEMIGGSVYGAPALGAVLKGKLQQHLDSCSFHCMIIRHLLSGSHFSSWSCC